jgi:hypothetical protein
MEPTFCVFTTSSVLSVARSAEIRLTLNPPSLYTLDIARTDVLSLSFCGLSGTAVPRNGSLVFFKIQNFLNV